MPSSCRPAVAYFGAGPAKLPEEVLQEAQSELLNWRDTGVGILEISHRSAEFAELMRESEARLRRIVGIPDDYAVLFMSGGGTLQFAAVVCNLLKRDATAVDYLISGTWSTKACEEAKKLLADRNVQVNPVALLSESEERVTLPAEWALSPHAAYVYYCDNETVDGIEMPSAEYIANILTARGVGVPVVCDMSSNFLSRPVDVSKFGVIFATAQKNFGPAGVTIVIVRRDLLGADGEDRLLPLPSMLDYGMFARHGSLYNTPPSFAISVCNLVFHWIEKRFGGDLTQLAVYSEQKSKLLYNCISESEGLYRCVAPCGFRSRMNVVFRICLDDGAISEELEAKFVGEAKAQGLLQIKGHRSVGGIRVSLYNAVRMEDTLQMLSFMRSFATHHR